MLSTQYHKILARSNALLEELTGNMQRWDNWSDEKKKTYNLHEKAEHGRYLFAQIKALIREHDTGSPFLDLCAEEDKDWSDDTGMLYHQYILILHAFNEHLESFVE
jgi:hypothetical protein